MPVRKRIFRYDKKKDAVVEVKQPSKRRQKAKWPIYSDAVGVSPNQVKEANHTMRKLGLRPNYMPNGTYMFESPGHRKEHCEHEEIQVYDRNGGYGDPQQPNKHYDYE